MKYGKKLPSDLEGDLNLIMNRLPTSWDVRTGIARDILEKMRDIVIDKINKLPEIEDEVTLK